MTAVGFKEQFAPAVEDGTKRQTIRQAKCNDKTCDRIQNQKDCDYIFCDFYEHRIKPGDTLQLYTGLRQRKYCKFPYIARERKCESLKEDLKCEFGDFCAAQGAKLLKTATCTESFLIKFEDLTEEIARLDGFKDITIKGPSGDPLIHTALEQLKAFLIKHYDAKAGDVFQVVRW